ncbi:hypothetical protein F5B19DRAFT_445209 [Rostrohypoxylon terebratum]|nr:hypothetical protein F5B19DRAFT_445209 [Rostrohypoxylon terebratum]
MSTKSLRHLRRLSPHLSLQPAVRPSANIIHHATQTSNFCHLSSLRHQFKYINKQKAPSDPNSHRVSPESFSYIKLTESDIPPLSFWKTFVTPPLVPADAVTAEECDETCREYVAQFAATPAARSRAALPPLLTLHYIASVLMNSPSGKPGLAMHIMYQLVRKSYAPSILTLSWFAVKTGHLLSDIRFAHAREGLEALANPAKGKSTSTQYRLDALTLLGQAYGARNTPRDDVKALGFLTTAAEVFAEKPNSLWVWHASAVLVQSEIYMRQKRPDLALSLFEMHAQKLDNANVLYAYAMLLPDHHPKRTPMLERAAISACLPAALELGRIEQRRAKEPGLSARERRDCEVLADEWFMIAGERRAA